MIWDVGSVASGKDDCALPAGSRLALSMVMHRLFFKMPLLKYIDVGKERKGGFHPAISREAGIRRRLEVFRYISYVS